MYVCIMYVCMYVCMYHVCMYVSCMCVRACVCVDYCSPKLLLLLKRTPKTGDGQLHGTDRTRNPPADFSNRKRTKSNHSTIDAARGCLPDLIASDGWQINTCFRPCHFGPASRAHSLHTIILLFHSAAFLARN